MAQETQSNVPKIRFNRFREAWVEMPLENAGEINPSCVLPESFEYVDLESVVGTEMVAHRTERKDSAPSRAQRLAKPGDLFYQMVRPYQRNNYLFKVPTGSYVFSTGYAQVRPNGEGDFLLGLVQREAFLKEVLNNCTGTSYPAISPTSLAKILVSIPDPAEQQLIGQHFAKLDEMISQHQRKHAKLVALKKAMLQKMFPRDGARTPEIRFKGFSGDWEENRLGKTVLIQRGGSPRPIESYITNESNGVNWIKIGDVQQGSRYITATKEKIRPEGAKNSREVYKGDLILSNSMSFGRPYIMAVDGCIHDGWLLIRNDQKIFELEFLLQLLGSDMMLNQYRALAAGGVVNNLNSELVQSTIILYPEIDEQRQIGSYFIKLDDLIFKHSTQINKLRNIKAACLEKMFV